MKRLQALCIYAGHCIPFLLCGVLIYIGKVPLTSHLDTVYLLQMLLASGLLFSLANTL